MAADKDEHADMASEGTHNLLRLTMKNSIYSFLSIYIKHKVVKVFYLKGLDNFCHNDKHFIVIF